MRRVRQPLTTPWTASSPPAPCSTGTSDPETVPGPSVRGRGPRGGCGCESVCRALESVLTGKLASFLKKRVRHHPFLLCPGPCDSEEGESVHIQFSKIQPRWQTDFAVLKTRDHLASFSQRFLFGRLSSACRLPRTARRARLRPLTIGLAWPIRESDFAVLLMTLQAPDNISVC